MKDIDEGVVKFRCDWRPGPALPNVQIASLTAWRRRLYARGLIGFDTEHQVGYGNVSRRHDGEIIITGTQTGHLAQLTGEHYVRVTAADLERNSVTCTGKLRASSETLTHAALYQIDPECNAVFHVHDVALWRALLGRVPTTDPAIPYGTPEMARALQRLWRDGVLPEVRVAAMAGHEGGILSLGDTADAAGNVLLAHLGTGPD